MSSPLDAVFARIVWVALSWSSYSLKPSMIGSRVNDFTIEAAWEMTLLARLPMATDAAFAMMLNRVPTFSADTPRDSRSMLFTAELI